MKLPSDETIVYVCGFFCGLFSTVALDIENRFYSVLAGPGVIIFSILAYKFFIYSKKWAEPSSSEGQGRKGK